MRNCFNESFPLRRDPMKLLLVGHACSPRRGSELAFTWNWAWHLSQTHEVWVETHPQERPAIEEFLTAHPNNHLRFEWVTLPRWLDPWNPRNDERHLWVHYVLWQKAALWRARQLHREIGFDLVHHISWGTINEPPPFWKLPIPFVWGPVGGGQVSPPAFRKYFGSAWRGEQIRTARMKLISHRPALRFAVRKSSLILSTNAETTSVLKRAGARSVSTFLDSGAREDFLAPDPPALRVSPQFKLLWVGQLVPRKCLPLALEAMAQTKDLPIRLLVAGRGSLRDEWRRLADDLGLGDRVVFLGHVSYAQMPALYRSADAFIFTSLRDSFGSQVLEAMSNGLPVIALDHQGVSAIMPDDAGIKVPVITPAETVAALGWAIRRLAYSPEERMRMGRAGWEFARTQTWSQRAEAISRIYQGIVRKEIVFPESEQVAV
jgi:glycosyltransferase involved in cell wall biosynthesis